MIEIKNMTLRLPGLREEEARRVGEEVARRLAQILPPGVGSRYIEQLNLQVKVPANLSRRRLAARITRELIRKMT